MTDDILIKYITGQCTEEEKSEVLAWLKEDIDHNRLFELEQIWGLKAEKQFSDSSRLDKSFGRLSRTIAQKDALKKKVNAKNLFVRCMKYAAAIAVVGLLTFNLIETKIETNNTPDNVVMVPKGQRVCLALSDGSKV